MLGGHQTAPVIIKPMRGDTAQNDAQESHRVFKTLGKALGGMAALAFALLLIQIFVYYRDIQGGAMPAMPQFSGQLSLGAKKAVAGNLVAGNLETSQDPFLGSSAPIITVVEFADYECPYSREVFSTFREMAAKYGRDVRFVYRDFPLQDVHTRALKAAIAGECAQEQNKFWQMHDRLYQSGDALSDADFMRYAQEMGLNMRDFSACFMSSGSGKRVEDDLRDGAALGVRGTPTFFVNGQKIEGAVPKETFDKLLKILLEKARQ